MDTPAEEPHHIAVGEINELRAQGVLPVYEPGDWSRNAQLRDELPNYLDMRVPPSMNEHASKSIAQVHYWFLSIIQEADEATQATVYRALAFAQRNTLAENLYDEVSNLDDPSRTEEEREELMKNRLRLGSSRDELVRADMRLEDELRLRRFSRR